MNFQKSSKNIINAFSLVELSIVIIIIGILVAAVANGSKILYNMNLMAAQKMDGEINAQIQGVGYIAMHLNAVNSKSFEDNQAIDGENITIWYDTKPATYPNPLNLSSPSSPASPRPQYKKKGINGLPSVEFFHRSANDGLIRNNVKISDISTNSMMTIFCVTRASKSTGVILNWNSGSSVVQLAPARAANDGKLAFVFGINSEANRTTIVPDSKYPADLFNKSQIMVVKKDENGVLIRNNGVELIKKIDANVGIPINETANFPFSDYFQGLVGEFIIFKTDVDISTIKKIEKFLSQKWGVEIVDN